MILAAKILEQLEMCRDDFSRFDHARRDETVEYEAALTRFASLSLVEIRGLLDGEEEPAALPTAEIDRAEGFTIPFPHDFQHHTAARGWAGEILAGQPIVAVDGSQIPLPADERLPLAAVQAAWFENHHLPTGEYAKEIEFEMLTPRDLRPAESGGDTPSPEQIINLRRFELEMRTLGRRLERLASDRKEDRPERLPIGLIDSSLVISFADRLPGEIRARYATALRDLLRLAQQTRIPVIGYVASSRARDLIDLLRLTCQLPARPDGWLDDSQLVSARLPWGARTPLLVCARGSADPRFPGILESLAEFRRGIGFTYLKASATAPPARLEIPLWIAEAGLLDRVIDLVRAEVIIGNGYPYAIEAADAAAAISGRERDRFYALCHHFLAERGLDPQPSPKSISKERRR
jgi:hypothetical protein